MRFARVIDTRSGMDRFQYQDAGHHRVEDRAGRAFLCWAAQAVPGFMFLSGFFCHHC